jgi:hypothetical protein
MAKPELLAVRALSDNRRPEWPFLTSSLRIRLVNSFACGAPPAPVFYSVPFFRGDGVCYGRWVLGFGFSLHGVVGRPPVPSPVAMRLGPDGPGWGCPEKAVGAAKAVGARWIHQRRLAATALFCGA